MSYQPITVCHPTRNPFVRCPSFIDGLGPPPYDFFDQVQDHISAYIHAQTGWLWSADTTEFDQFNAPTTLACPPFHLRYAAGLTVTNSYSLPSGITTTTAQGEHAGLAVGSLATPWYFKAATAIMVLGGDFLISAKVKLLGRENFDQGEGLFIGLDEGQGADGTLGTGAQPYGFRCGGGASETWRLEMPGRAADSGRAVESNRWYVLQMSRINGGIRWFIDGRLIKIEDEDGILREGVYMPDALTTRRNIRVFRSAPGSVGDAFYIDYFHRFCQR